jgi:CRISPR-associated endoribonuclease Cas6
VVLEFRGKGKVSPPTPERLHAAFLGLVSRGDRALGKLLHSARSQRPFTLHLLGLEDGLLRVRLSVLAPELFANFWNFWEKKGGISLQIGKNLLQPISISKDSPWCGTSSWQELLEREPTREMALLFASPTAFKAGDLDLPLPVPRLVFKGLLAKWNLFSPYPISTSTEDLERRVALAEATIQTQRFFDGRAHIVGFVGKAVFRLLRGSSPELVRGVNTLADFAFFAGVGRKTTHGMGLTKRMEP